MRLLAFIGALAIVVAIGATAYFFGGYYSVAATQEDPGIVKWALVHVRMASIEKHATASPPASFDTPANVQAGARAFLARGCTNCHGGPGVDWAKFSEGLRPDPPDLKDVVKERNPSQLFWVIKNGINMTGMPSFGAINVPDAELWNIVAFLTKLPTIKDADFKTWTAAAAAPRAGSASGPASRGTEAVSGVIARRLGCVAIAAALAYSAAGIGSIAAQPAPPERVTFPSLDGTTVLTGFFFPPTASSGPRPALVLLHGCTGLGTNGHIFPVYRSWARLFAAAGYLALMVDSAGSRHIGQTCTAGPDRRRMMRERPRDAYAALRYLQSLPSVRGDRVGAVGWSQGGATILNAISSQSRARPNELAHDFRTAVAFYPGRCSDKMQSRPFVNAEPHTWTTAVPLLVLLGEADNWTPAAPCAALMTEAKTRKAPVELKLYPGAYHVFDAPNLPKRELPAYKMQNGVVPISGTDADAWADALTRVPEFLRRHLREDEAITPAPR